MKNETCLECGNKIGKYGVKFCSRRCSGLYNNRNCENLKNVRKGPLPTLERYNNCLWCGSTLKKSARKYCSVECQTQYRREERAKEWLKGKLESVTVKDGFSRSMRYYILEKHSYKCSKCGWGEINPFTGFVPLEINHIDGNAYNNSPENIELLCPNCHSLTEFHKGLNKNNGKRIHMRQYRKKRRTRKAQIKNYLDYKIKSGILAQSG